MSNIHSKSQYAKRKNIVNQMSNIKSKSQYTKTQVGEADGLHIVHKFEKCIVIYLNSYNARSERVINE